MAIADKKKITSKDIEAVAQLLGREPQGDFEVVARTDSGAPRVIKNFPLLYDLTPMPTLYWLVDSDDCLKVSQLESKGFVKLAEKEVSAETLAEAHEQYRILRDEIMKQECPDHDGPTPSGGVGGTARGVKCLHAHYAWHLAGGDDPVGKWLLQHL